MDPIGKSAVVLKTPAKDPQSVRSKVSEKSKCPENVNPNVSPISKFVISPAGVKSASKTQKSGLKNPSSSVASPSPRNKIRERKFVVAKKKNSKREKSDGRGVTCKCKAGANSSKCLCVAYESLRASQEEFFKNRSENVAASEVGDGEDDKILDQNPNFVNGCENKAEEEGNFVAADGGEGEIDPSSANGSTNVKRRRAKLLEEARQSIPEPGSGRVMHLVKAFENLLSIPKSTGEEDEKDVKEKDDAKSTSDKWALPGLMRPKAPETQISSSSFCPSEFLLTSESLGLDSRVSSSLDSSQGSFSILNRNSGGGRRSRRNSAESCVTFGGSRWKRRQLKITSQRPFKLRTEERGKSKEEEFMKKVHEMMIEEEKQRIPIAQGLPWTTDEPECLVKPPVKEITRPIDLVLHSDVRAVERAEFDQQVAEKLSLIEQYKLERERQQKMAEEEELRRLRKELVPKAQPMPYFDRPFIPRRSEKHPTIPREPKFHIPQHKKMKSCISWNDMMYTHQQ